LLCIYTLVLFLNYAKKECSCSGRACFVYRHCFCGAVIAGWIHIDTVETAAVDTAPGFADNALFADVRATALTTEEANAVEGESFFGAFAGACVGGVMGATSGYAAGYNAGTSTGLGKTVSIGAGVIGAVAGFVGGAIGGGVIGGVFF
jgi:hypothetical protein